MRWFSSSYSNLTDEELMKRLASGDKKAFDMIYERYATPMLHYFHRMLWKDREKAEDFVQDLFTKIIHNPASFDASRTFKTWLYSVANNMCKNEYKKQVVRSGTKNGLDENLSISDANESVFVVTHNLLFAQEFENQLALLDEKHREAFTLRHIDGLSIKEIADLIQISEGTIKSRIFYATKQLAKRLAHYKPEKLNQHG